MRFVGRIAIFVGIFALIVNMLARVSDHFFPNFIPLYLKEWIEPVPELIISTFVLIFGIFIEIYRENTETNRKVETLEQKVQEIRTLSKQTLEQSKESSGNASRSLLRLNDIILKLGDYSGLTPIHVTVSNFKNFFIYVPFYVAQEFGLFKEEDLKVDLKSQGNDDTAFEAVLNKGFQLAITDPAMVLRNLGEGRVIAPLITKAALWGLSTKPINVPTSVVTYPSPSTAYYSV